MLRRCAIRAATVEKTHGGRTVSRLANGMRVMSYEDGTAVTGLGFYTRMGARYETGRTAGATAVIEASFLRGNQARDARDQCRALHLLGSSVRTSSDVREIFGWCMNVPRYALNDGLQFLADAALTPAINDPAVFEASRDTAMNQSALFDRDATRVCFEHVHQAAFGAVALGRPLWVTEEAVAKLTPEIVSEFHAALVQPERSVLVASGVSDHEKLVESVERIFAAFPTPPARPLEYGTDVGYTGGQRLIANDKAPDSVIKFEEKNLTHIALCFKGIPMQHPDYFAYTVVQTLMGGGTSFSSGGPGKGMHTKLFREVIMRHGWLHGMECISAWYENAGLIGLYGQAEHEFAQPLFDTMMQQAATIPARVEDSHVEMAKNQLMSQLVLLAEARDIALEEAGKNVLQHNSIVTPDDILRGAGKVTLDDIRRVCKAFIQTPPTIVIYGNIDKARSPDDVSRIVQALHAKHC